MRLTARQYTDADWPMVLDWWDGHGPGDRAISRAILPPVGIIVQSGSEAQGALWCHLSVDCLVAFLDYPVTKPGLSLAEAGTVFGVAIGAMEAICRRHNRQILIANALPGCARWLERNAGFLRTGERVQMAKLI